jgi:uncharacterized protein (TIGR02596 family)
MIHHRVARNTSISRGFSLAEIIIVVTIMMILVTLAAPSMSGVMDSLRMKEAVSNTRSTMEQARQAAIAMNRDVTVRFYRVADEAGELAWRGYTYGTEEVITDPNDPQYKDPTAHDYQPAFVASVSMERLPQSVVFHSSATFSRLLDETQSALRSGKEKGADGAMRTYTSFKFTPDGRCTLPAAQAWTLTIIPEKASAQTTTLPPDYTTLQLDPTTARVRVYRR